MLHRSDSLKKTDENDLSLLTATPGRTSKGIPLSGGSLIVVDPAGIPATEKIVRMPLSMLADKTNKTPATTRSVKSLATMTGLSKRRLDMETPLKRDQSVLVKIGGKGGGGKEEEEEIEYLPPSPKLDIVKILGEREEASFKHKLEKQEEWPNNRWQSSPSLSPPPSLMITWDDPHSLFAADHVSDELNGGRDKGGRDKGERGEKGEEEERENKRFKAAPKLKKNFIKKNIKAVGKKK